MSSLLNPYRFAATAGGDPDFASVVLLLHCDGTNGSTTFPDNSGSVKTVSANGGAQVTTSTKKFGSGGMLLDGAGDWASVPASADFNYGTDPFTIEFFVNFQSTARMYLMDYATTNTSAIAVTPSSGKVEVYATSGGFRINAGSTAFSTNTWYHLALVRDGGTWTIYRDGTLYVQQTGLSALTWGSSSLNLSLGCAGAGAGIFATAHFDEWRITKGVARDVTSIPAAAFPDS